MKVVRRDGRQDFIVELKRGGMGEQDFIAGGRDRGRGEDGIGGGRGPIGERVIVRV